MSTHVTSAERTPADHLYLAILNRKNVEEELAKGADPNSSFATSTMPAIAVKTGELASVQALIAAKANVNLADSSGLTPLHAACSGTTGSQEDTLKIVQLLLSHNAEPNSPANVMSPLELAIRNSASSIIIAELINAKANVNTKFGDGFKPLAHARLAAANPMGSTFFGAERNKVVQLLLEAKANP